MRNFLVPENLLNAIIGYLGQRPIVEANDMFHGLRQCEPADAAKAAPKKPETTPAKPKLVPAEEKKAE